MGEVIKVCDFSLSQTLECGQCFHFRKIESDHYVFVHKNKAYDIRQEGDNLILLNFNKKEFDEELINYFDLNTDYGKIKNTLLSKDERLRNSIEEMSGIKILRQDFFETLMSFIISANNQIARIKSSVEQISYSYGEYLGTYYDIDFYAFPKPIMLENTTEDDFRRCGVGFRDKYLVSTVKSFISGDISADMLSGLNEEECVKELMKIKGVGIKVASCVMLFSLSIMTAFPIDVWIKRIMQNIYFDGEKTDNKEILKLARRLYAPYEGYAQQYLFHYGRTRG